MERSAMTFSDGELRQRKKKTGKPNSYPHGDTKTGQDHHPCDEKEHIKRSSNTTYWLTRIILLRYIAFIYGVAFLVAYDQNRALMGSKGLLPADKYLKNIELHSAGNLWKKLTYAPTLFWLFDYAKEGQIDALLHITALVGMLISAFVLCTGTANMLLMAALWILYHSICSVGQRWYSFGWESQLLESGFLAIFLCPLFSLNPLPMHTPTPKVVLWGYRWLIFRIMIGAGLIKIRGDQCWRDLTCMNYHYQTQPVPNALSPYLHQAPEWWHKVETGGNHFVELIAPLLIITPIRRLQIIGGIIQILFQIILISSGNLSFLNWLTILPCLSCFDDSTLSMVFTKSMNQKLSSLQVDFRRKGFYIRRVMEVSLAILIGYLSIPVIQNLLSTRQAMNTSFDPLRLVNTYGAFGSITRERTEIIIQGTYDSPEDESVVWQDYEFKCKPGNVSRRPCLISPYHYRLDWLMWFAAFQNYQHNPWLVHLVAKLLSNDQLTIGLIEHNPFEGRRPPKYIRMEHFLYEYSKVGSRKKQWWTRRRIGSYMPSVSLRDLRPYLKSMGWTSTEN